MLERNTSSVTNVGRRAAFPTVSDTRGYIKGRDPIRVKNVRRASNGAQTSLNIRESTPARSHMGVLCVGNVSVRAQPSLHTRGLTLEKSLINVLNVGKALDRVHTLSDTKGSTEIKSHCFDMAAAWLFGWLGFFRCPETTFFGIWSISVNCGSYFHRLHTQDRSVRLTGVSVPSQLEHRREAGMHKWGALPKDGPVEGPSDNSRD